MSNGTPDQDGLQSMNTGHGGPSDGQDNAAGPPPPPGEAIQPARRYFALRLLMITLAHLVILGHLVVQHLQSLNSGQTIWVYSRANDPDDFVAGDEIYLTYTFGEFSLAELDGSDDFFPGEDAYMVLSPVRDRTFDQIWAPIRVENTRRSALDLGPDDVVVNGEVAGLAVNEFTFGGPASITLRFGIERYRVTSRASDYFRRPSNVPGGLIAVELVVDDSGRAIRRGLIRRDLFMIDRASFI